MADAFNWQAEDPRQRAEERYLIELYRGSAPELRARILEAVERTIAADMRSAPKPTAGRRRGA